MPQSVEEAMRLIRQANKSDLKFAASEAIASYHYDEYCQHIARKAGEDGFFYAKARSVEILNDQTALLSFRRRYWLWGERVAPFRVSTLAIANKLEVIYIASRSR